MIHALLQWFITYLNKAQR